MISRFSAMFAKEILTKSVPKACFNVTSKKQFMSSLIAPRNLTIRNPLIIKKIPVNRSLFSIVNKLNCDKNIALGQQLSCFNVISRGVKTKKVGGIKTKKAAAKRFIKTGKGELKYGTYTLYTLYV